MYRDEALDHRFSASHVRGRVAVHFIDHLQPAIPSGAGVFAGHQALVIQAHGVVVERPDPSTALQKGDLRRGVLVRHAVNAAVGHKVELGPEEIGASTMSSSGRLRLAHSQRTKAAINAMKRT